jgi:hypothetical protein
MYLRSHVHLPVHLRSHDTSLCTSLYTPCTPHVRPLYTPHLHPMYTSLYTPMYSSSKSMYEEALSMNAASNEAVLHLYTAMQELVDWDDLDIMFERVVNATSAQLAAGELPTMNPYHSLLTNVGLPLTLAIALAHARHTDTKFSVIRDELNLSPPPLPWGLGSGAAQTRGASAPKLRVGYIMADWRQHVTAHLLQTVFERHDARRVAAYAFALNQDDGGAFRRRIRKSFGPGRFVEAFGISDEEVATLVNKEQIHVLIDIDYNKLRLSILALRPASVQVKEWEWGIRAVGAGRGGEGGVQGGCRDTALGRNARIRVTKCCTAPKTRVFVSPLL